MNASSGFQTGIGLPCHRASSGFGSNKSTCDGPPYMKRKITDFAFGAKCGARGSSGFVDFRTPSAASNDRKPSAPNPAPAC